MKRNLSRRPTPAMVVAVVALCLSLTGGAVAATLITGADIKNGSIAAKDLKRGAVNTKKVKNRSLLKRDFKAGQLPAGATGPQGPKGDPCAPADPACVGPKGDKGDTGATGAVSGVVNRQNFVTIPDGSNAGVEVTCNEGERLIGGGAAFDQFVDDANLLSSRPSTATGAVPVDGAAFTHWRAAARNTTGATGNIELRVYAVCATS